MHLSRVLALLFLMFGILALAQNKYEREYRIKKSQFPEKALGQIEEKLKGARNIRFYKETDSTKVVYKIKFKKNRLKYSAGFNEDSTLEDIEILIKPVDIPNDAYKAINKYLQKEFIKYRIQKIHQQYPIGNNSVEITIKNAFQNLILASIKYELIVSGKKNKGYERFEALFDSEGNFEKIWKSLPPNYDHVLY